MKSFPVARCAVPVLGATLAFSIALAHARNSRQLRIEQQAERIAELEQELAQARSTRSQCTAEEDLLALPSETASGAPIPSMPENTVARGLRAEAQDSPNGTSVEACLASASGAEHDRIRAIRAMMRTPRQDLVHDALRAILSLDPSEGILEVERVVDSSWRNQETQYVALRALKLLADVPDPGADTLLYRYFDQRESLMLRARAARVLATRGDLRPSGSLSDRLIPLLNGPDATERSQAALALGYLRDEATLPDLTRALRDGNSNVRFSAVMALSRFDARLVATDLKRMLGDPDLRVKALAQQLTRR